jgi:AcrR family transcriptional regulator
MTGGTAGRRYGEPVMAPAATTRDDTRRALLDAAHDLLASEGPGALTVRRIAAAAGVSTMNVYSRFGGKDGVLDELFNDGFRRLCEVMSELPVTDDPIADLRLCAATYRAFARRNATYYTLMFDRAVPEFEPSETAQTAALDALGHLVGRVERAMAAGVLRADDPFTVATGLWACQHGLVSLEARTDERDDEFDWEAVQRTTVDALLRGLA